MWCRVGCCKGLGIRGSPRCVCWCAGVMVCCWVRGIRVRNGLIAVRNCSGVVVSAGTGSLVAWVFQWVGVRDSLLVF